MKKISSLFLLSLLIIGKLNAQIYVPVATTGYTLDAVAENTTAVGTTGGAIDGSDYVLYSTAYGALVSSSYGLPNSGVIGSSPKTFQLQSYTGPNLLYITGSLQDSLTFVTPAPCYSISLLGFATEGAGSMSVTVRFTDNTTQVFTGITLYDWFNTVPTPFYNGFDRVTRTTGTVANVGGTSGNPRMFTNDLTLLCANQSKKVKRIIVKNTSTARLCIMAVSAVLSPFAATVNPVSLCVSGTSTVSAAGALSTSGYTWLPVGAFAGSNATVVPVTPTVTTDYTVQTTGYASCVLNAVVTVSVFGTAPTLTIVNTAPSGGICPTKTVNITANGATTYTWTGGSTTVTNGVTFVPTSTTDYTVTATNACGTSSAIASVSLFPLPTVIPSASSPSLCAGNSVTLNATGNGTLYTWVGTFTSGVGFVPALTATYTVIGTSALSCTASAAVPVTVVAIPNAPSTANPALNCLGKTVTLTAVSAANYTWTSATQTVFTSSMTVTPTSAGVSTYTVLKANANCTFSQVVTVVTNSLPTVFAIVTPTIVCALNPATLAVGGGQTYTWTSPGNPPAIPSFTFGGSSPIVNPPVSTNYTVAASDGTCVAITTVSLTANPNPTITTVPSATAICVGQSVTVNANGGNSYTWTSTANTNTFTGASITDSPIISVSYNVSGDNSFGCVTSAGQVIVVNPNPTITINANKTLVCSGGATTLTANGANTYTWDANAGGVITASAGVTPTSLTTGAVIYTVVGSYSATNCQTAKTIAISVFVPTLTVVGNTNTCLGGLITLTVSGGNNGSYVWNTGSGPLYTFPVLNTTIAAAGIVTVSALTTSVSVICPVTKTVAVGIYFSPTITAVPQRTPVCFKESVQLFAGGGSTYQWNNGMTGSTITVSPPNSNTTYTVVGTDANGCTGTVTVLVKMTNCTGISELGKAANGLVIYPNPNNGEFTIETTGTVSLTLINELGQTVKTIELTEANNYKLSVTDLAKGIYFVSGQKDNELIRQKIVVTK